MYQTLFITILATYFVLANGITGGESISPCPDILTYLPDEITPTSWSAQVLLKADTELRGIWLIIVFDSQPTNVTSENFEIIPGENNQFLLRNQNRRVPLNSQETLKFKVTHSGSTGAALPKVIGIYLNAKVICSSCSYKFEYDDYDPTIGPYNQWSGTLTLKSGTEIATVSSSMIFDKPPLEVVSDYEDPVQIRDVEYILQKSEKLAMGLPLKIKLIVKYENSTMSRIVPVINDIRLEDKSCYGMVNKPPQLADELITPCPQIFEYEKLEKSAGKWYGKMAFNFKYSISDLNITVVLDGASLQFGGWTGNLKTQQDNREYMLTKPGLTINPGLFTVKFFIKFKTSKPIPRILEILVNSKEVCPVDVGNILNPIELNSYNTQATPQPLQLTQQLQSVDVPQSFQSPQNFQSSQAYQTPQTKITSSQPDEDYFFAFNADLLKKSSNVNADEDVCGQIEVAATPLITNGQSTQPGQHPWHVALYHNKNVDLTYICGGNLISKYFVVTAAHCATRQATGQALRPSLLAVVLGKFYLDQLITAGVQQKQIEKVIVHPDYDRITYSNDISLLKMNTAAYITETVRPICLWRGSSELNEVIGEEGIVVGWGWNERSEFSEHLVKTGMPIVSTLTCIKSNPVFFAKFINDNNFCAGFRNGSSACNGDSGGGLTLSRQESGKTVWYLRGLVSIGIARQNLDKTMCDPSHYVVFTDVAKYTDWIVKTIRSY